MVVPTHAMLTISPSQPIAKASRVNLHTQANPVPTGGLLERELGDAVEDSGFSINPSKTRMQIQGSRQEVTGLIVNEKVNIRQEYFRSVRNMCHSLFQTGEYYVKSAVDGGESGEPERTNKLAPLEGRLAHIYYVKVRCNRHQENNRSAPPEAPRELYRRFLFFKYFVASDFQFW